MTPPPASASALAEPFSGPSPEADRRIRLLPLDGRPVCLSFPRLLATMAGVTLQTPPPSLLGALKQPGDRDGLASWLAQDAPAPLILALDALAYGGLIPSRLGDEPLSALQTRVESALAPLTPARIWAFSSILRIPNYDNAEEEPAYWAQYGRALYAYSQAAHREALSAQDASPRVGEGVSPTAAVPAPILSDFLARRTRNFSLNRAYLDAMAAGRFEALTFCQDDTGPIGLNVQEAEALRHEAQARGLGGRVRVQTGADELAATSLARWLHGRRATPLRVFTRYSAEQGDQILARFDGQPIAEVVARQIAACGAVPAESPQEADLLLLAHTPAARMGDWCEGVGPDADAAQRACVLNACREAFSRQQPLILADVACANGADDALSASLLTQFQDLTPLYGYAAWNTPGNAIGSALAMGVLRALSEGTGHYRPEAHRRALLTRLADDWLYQTRVRATLRRLARSGRDALAPEPLAALMTDGLALIQSRLGLEGEPTRVRFPCTRTFEVEIAMGDD